MMSDDQRTDVGAASGSPTGDADTTSGGPTGDAGGDRTGGGADATPGTVVTGSEVAAKEDLSGGTSDGDTPSGHTGG